MAVYYKSISNQKFDLFSYEGTEILNKYINVVKWRYLIKVYLIVHPKLKMYKVDKSVGRFTKIISKGGKVYDKCRYINKGGAGEIYLYKGVLKIT